MPRNGHLITRRTLVLGGLGTVLAGCAASPEPTAPGSSGAAASTSARQATATADLTALEAGLGGRIGVHAVDTGTGTTVAHRADERFLMCSTHKALVAAAVLRTGVDLDRLVRYDESELLSYAPVTSQHVADGMTVAALCEAAITRSDNTADNLLLEILGGPQAVTAFVRTLGDDVTRLDRVEPDLNVGAPGDERDTSTPARMVADLRELVLDDGLDPAGRDRLTGWLTANTTGDDLIRAGLPAGWRVGDKTGSGAAGEVNDIAVVWPPGRAPWVVAVYAVPTDPKSTAVRAAVASASRIVTAALT
ncbi:class A beta-lactamase [Umezawaea tangerina]|uniref:Beta-lactamase n=1 Tax=Umezawaea tangerina TaxID=84725 RepID=A0A2T0TGX3_9PSEU|nr:class A beta-lactamase [Umezawaea tangerina]PRY44946.1 beta-lactamase class A [Umezawaea tangerina]